MNARGESDKVEFMEDIITREKLAHLKELAKVHFPEGQEEKMLRDLEKVIDYFEELKEVHTETVTPAAGGSFNTNVFRDDSEKKEFSDAHTVGQFPESHGDLLCMPPVFGNGE